jgi:acetylornithine deacetylase
MQPNNARAAVLDQIDRLTADMVGAASRLVQIPSISGSDEENAAQAHMADLLARGGLDVDHWPIDVDDLSTRPDFPGTEVDRREAWGLVGRLAGSGDGATLMLNGHIDVVPIGDPDAWSGAAFTGDVRDGRLWGRGACDMKAGLIAAHWAVQAIRTSGVRLRGDVLVASVQGEEDGGLGTYALLERGWRADACVIPEPTDLDIVPANAGALTFRLRIRGHATHASRRTDGVSVVEKFIPVWHALQELERRRTSSSTRPQRGGRSPIPSRSAPSAPETGRRRFPTCSSPKDASAWRSTNRSRSPDSRWSRRSPRSTRATPGCASTRWRSSGGEVSSPPAACRPTAT